MANPNSNIKESASATEEAFPAPEGYKWVGSGQTKRLEKIPVIRAHEPHPVAFRVKNVGEHPHLVWPHPTGMLAPGQVSEVPPEHRVDVHRKFADGIYAGGVTPWGDKYPATLEITEEPVITVKQLADLAEEQDRARELAQGHGLS